MTQPLESLMVALIVLGATVLTGKAHSADYLTRSPD